VSLEASLRGERVVLRPTRPADAGALRAILATPEVAAWWGPVPEGFPSHDDPAATRLSILHDGRIAGLIQYSEEPDPDYRHARIDIFVDPRLHGRGLGTDATTTLVRHLVEDRGHHRVTIDPASDNGPAIRCYEKVGFRRVGVMHAAWRDPATGAWRDTLLMELVTPPARRARDDPRRQPRPG
jgi:aminoglycoside 6'-N-acetyltransferase